MKSIKSMIAAALAVFAISFVCCPVSAQNAYGAGPLWDGYVSGVAEASGDGGWLACADTEARPREWRIGAICVKDGLLPTRSGSVQKFTLDQLLNHWLQRPKLRASAVGALPAYILSHRAKGGDDYSQSRNIVVIAYKIQR